MERAFKGVWIDREIWLNKELSWMEKLFITEINSLDNEKGCFASNKYFADFFNLSKSRCSQIITELKNKGYVSIELIKGDSEKGTVTKRVVRILNRGIKNTKHPPLENCEYSNTKSNNTKKEETPLIRGVKRSPSQSNIKYHPLAEKLVEGIASNDAQFFTNKNMEKTKEEYSKHFRLLVERDGRGIEQVSEILDWCIEDQGNGNFPGWGRVIQSARKFREKFPVMLQQFDRGTEQLKEALRKKGMKIYD